MNRAQHPPPPAASRAQCNHCCRLLASTRCGPRWLLVCACDDCLRVLRERGWDSYAAVAP